MGKGKGLTFTLFAVLGALSGYASYMARKDEFSDETKNKYDNFVNKAKNVVTDIQRTYTSIGDKKEFTNNTKNLSESAKKLASKAGDLVMSATVDMYNQAKTQVAETLENAKNDFYAQETVSRSTKATPKKTSVKKTVKAKKKSTKRK